MKSILATSLFILLFLSGCSNGGGEQSAESMDAPVAAPPTAADVLARAVVAHGGSRYDRAAYGFTFRDRAYTFRNQPDGSYVYTRRLEKDGHITVDTLTNDAFVRYVDGQKVDLSEKDIARYGSSVNSVVYFATLPHKLQDPAVNLSLAGEQTVKGETYDLLRVHFDEEGGGEDHDDNFVYWVNRATDRIDYLAYDYRTDGGGVRFRSAYEPRIVNGITFQHYVNYKAPIGTKLEELSGMFERGELEELSRIETEEVTAL